MCPDPAFDEDQSLLVYGPIHKQRWIYSASKQLLDRVIYAFGAQEGLPFTLFRPFNWIGPRLDRIDSPKEGSSRVLTEFLRNILRGEPLKLVDGGSQRRSFTYIGDGIDCLMRILINDGGRADGCIFNIGNPANDVSIRELAALLIAGVARYPGGAELARAARTEEVRSEVYYGTGYQDILTRVPSIRRAKERLGWEPKVGLEEAIGLTLDYYLAGRLQPSVP